MDTLPPPVADWMQEKGFILGEQQPHPVLAAAGAGALPFETLPPIEMSHPTEQTTDDRDGPVPVGSKDGKSEEDEV
jgi:hypothetical protein